MDKGVVNMEGSYPIIIGGETTGRLTVSRDGLMTVFDARCRDEGRLMRLSVYGESEGYLGVMRPEDGECRLLRRMSRSALASFPPDFTHAGESGGCVTADIASSEAEALPEKAPAASTEPECPEKSEAPPAVVQPRETPPGREPLPEGDLIWRRGRFGVLRAGEGDCELVAVPVSGQQLPSGELWQLREIEGEPYAVFQVKDGKLT